MIVVDASVVANAFTDDGPVGVSARAELARDDHWAAPPHLEVEVFSAIRGRLLGGHITQERAADALNALATVHVDAVATTALLPRMWELRSNVSGYDSAYVAAAETLGCPLVTADARLGEAPGPHCEIRVALPSE